MSPLFCTATATFALALVSTFAAAQEPNYNCMIRASDGLILCQQQGQAKPAFEYKLAGFTSLQNAPVLDKESKSDGRKLELFRHAVENYRDKNVEGFRTSSLEKLRRKADDLLQSGAIDIDMYHDLIDLYRGTLTQSYQGVGMHNYQEAVSSYKQAWIVIKN